MILRVNSSSLMATKAAAKARNRSFCATRVASVGLDVVAVRDPGSTRIGEQIRAVLLNPDHTEMSMRCEMLLYMAARAEMKSRTNSAGRWPRRKRSPSATGLSPARWRNNPGGDGLANALIRKVADVAISGRWPDLTILLDMPPEASLARVQRAKDRIEQRPMAYHEQVGRNTCRRLQADPPRYRLIRADQTRVERFDAAGDGSDLIAAQPRSGVLTLVSTITGRIQTSRHL